nr:PREDICTED: uncharacterized protein LOC105662824 isoform X1 [Megachile rotundata]
MLVKFVAALIVGTITACVGPFYYCKKFREKCGTSNKCFDKSESFESESPLIHIKITHPCRNEFTNKTTSDACDDTRNSADPKESKETKQVVRDVGQVSTKESRIVPYKTSLNQKRTSTKIWSSAMRGKLNRIKSSSTELCGSSKVVRAQVEVNPSSSSSNEASDIHGHIHSNSSRLTSSQSNLADEKVRKLSSVAVKKWKNLKRTLICSRSEKSTVQKEAGKEGLTVPTHNSTSRYSPLQKSRLVDVSTSTRLSANVQNEPMTKNNLENSNESQKVRRCSSAEALQEIASLIQSQSINGTSICDVKIKGLTMNQTDLMNLFQATNQSGTPSIIATEEASIISIKFHRGSSSKNTSYYECPLRKIYRKLPELFEDLSFSELLKSEEVEKSHRATPAIQVSEYSDRMNDSRNETSYIDLPKLRNGLMAEEVFTRRRTSRRFNGR